jgi:hypothetical protein
LYQPFDASDLPDAIRGTDRIAKGVMQLDDQEPDNDEL